jgi:hypothetical protein
VITAYNLDLGNQGSVHIGATFGGGWRLDIRLPPPSDAFDIPRGVFLTENQVRQVAAALLAMVEP